MELEDLDKNETVETVSDNPSGRGHYHEEYFSDCKELRRKVETKWSG